MVHFRSIGVGTGPPSVADLEIQKGGFSHWRTKHSENFLVATPTSGHVNTFMTHVIIVATCTDALVAR